MATARTPISNSYTNKFHIRSIFFTITFIQGYISKPILFYWTPFYIANNRFFFTNIIIVNNVNYFFFFFFLQLSLYSIMLIIFSFLSLSILIFCFECCLFSFILSVIKIVLGSEREDI